MGNPKNIHIHILILTHIGTTHTHFHTHSLGLDTLASKAQPISKSWVTLLYLSWHQKALLWDSHTYRITRAFLWTWNNPLVVTLQWFCRQQDKDVRVTTSLLSVIINDVSILSCNELHVCTSLPGITWSSLPLAFSDHAHSVASSHLSSSSRCLEKKSTTSILIWWIWNLLIHEVWHLKKLVIEWLHCINIWFICQITISKPLHHESRWWYYLDAVMAPTICTQRSPGKDLLDLSLQY